jgi:thioredoxin 2
MTTRSGDSHVDTIDCPHCGARNRVPAEATSVAQCGHCHQALPWVTMAGDDDFNRVVTNSTLPVLLDLWAPCYVSAGSSTQASGRPHRPMRVR